MFLSCSEVITLSVPHLTKVDRIGAVWPQLTINLLVTLGCQAQSMAALVASTA